MTIQILAGDCRDVLRSMPPESVYCVVTSPPYFGLRDYGIPSSIWGGDAACEHAWIPMERSAELRRGLGLAASGASYRGGGHKAAKVGGIAVTIGGCEKCGAWQGSLGLEPALDLYVAHMVEVFREVRRVLRADGTLWLNLGDSYASGGTGGASDKSGLNGGRGVGPLEKIKQGPAITRKPPDGLKPKDLIGIPWRVAFALQADGWWLRQDIIWAKPNPMPESVTDRCTKAHEYLFLLAKSRRYRFDAKAISEPIKDQPFKRRHKRSVWTVATTPFADAHFATFPPDLIEPAILAGCPRGGVVLDPFGGAGTTAMTADRLGRNAIMIEIGPQYVAMAKRRMEGEGGLDLARVALG